jgi:ribonuclease D
MTADAPPRFQARAISREEMAALPLRRYCGEVCFVDSETALARATADFEHERVVGFDTETRPSFVKGEHYLPSLVQVATARAVFIFPLRYRESHRVLAMLLDLPRIVKAGVAVGRDVQELKELFDFAGHNVVDIGRLARRAGLEQTGVRNLAGLLLGFRVPKGAKTTNWAAARLTPVQIEYAATDAWVSRELMLEFERLGHAASG